MPIRSSYQDVEIPEVSLHELLFGDFGDRVDAPAFIDGGSGRTNRPDEPWSATP